MSFDHFIEKVGTKEQKQIIFYLHHHLHKELLLQIKMNYGIPFYYNRKWVCYLNPIKKTEVELAFIYGHLLSNEQGLLQDHGRKQVRGVRFSKLKEATHSFTEAVIQEALLLDERLHENKKG